MEHPSDLLVEPQPFRGQRTIRKIQVTQGWKFTVVNGDRYLVRVGISDLAAASKVALEQVQGGHIKKYVQLSALEVEQLNIFNTFNVTRVRSGNESRKVDAG